MHGHEMVISTHSNMFCCVDRAPATSTEANLGSRAATEECCPANRSVFERCSLLLPQVSLGYPAPLEKLPIVSDNFSERTDRGNGQVLLPGLSTAPVDTVNMNEDIAMRYSSRNARQKSNMPGDSAAN